MVQGVTADNRRSVLTTGLILVLANLLPMLAVWKLDWKIYDLLVLYWIEIIVIGVLNLGRMTMISAHGTASMHFWKVFFVPFFAAHFGFFCVGLALAIQLLFGRENFQVEDQVMDLINGSTRQLLWPLMISHVFSLFWNYLGQREWQNTTVIRRMFQPYWRAIPLAITTIGLGFIVYKMNLPIWSLLVFIGIKTTVDLIIHVIMHFRIMTHRA